MRRSVVLISAAVTAFSLVMVASVVYAYGVMAAPRPTSVQAYSQAPAAADVAAAPVAAPAAAASTNIAPQDAAALASRLLGRTDAYSVELTTYAGSESYKVTFSSGDVVYVGLNGQILATVPVTTSTPSTSVARNTHSGGAAFGSGSGESEGSSYSEHEDGGSTSTEGGD